MQLTADVPLCGWNFKEGASKKKDILTVVLATLILKVLILSRQ